MPLGRPFTLIGSRNRAHLHLLSSTVSRNHACIISTDTGLYLRDLASRTGVLVEGRKAKDVDLHDGDAVQIGSFRFRFSDPAGATRLGITPKAVAAMLEMDGSTLTPIDSRTLLIGRRPACDISLPEASVSNTHALIFEINGQRFIRDLGSRTGTLVNGKPVHHQELEFGDEIRIGETEFRYVSAAAPRRQPVELAAEDLAPSEDEEPIGLAFDDRGSADEAEIESIPEAEEHELLPVNPEDLPEEEPLGVARTAPPEELAPPRLGEAADLHEEPIDFEIAGSQLDLQKKLVEHSRLVAEPQDSPTHAVTASQEVLQPVEDLGLDFWNDDAEAAAKGAAPAAAPDEAPAVPAEPDVTDSSQIAVDPEPVAPVQEPAEESYSIPPASEPAPEVLTADEVDVSPPQPVSEEAAPAEPEALKAPAPLASQTEEVPSPAPEQPAVQGDLPSASIDAVDLSVVDFGQESQAVADASPPAWTEEAAEPTAESKPLLDLDAELAPPPGVSGAPSSESASPPESEVKPGKKPKAPRRRRPRKKKGELVTTEAQDVVPAVPMEPDASHDVAAPASDVAIVASEADLPEVIPTSEPTPDSAQELGDALEAAAPPPATTSQLTAPDELTDTAFERVVQEFTGAELGPIVENPVEAEAAAPAPEATDASKEPAEVETSTDVHPAPDAQATIPDEGLSSEQPTAIAELDPMVSPPTFAFDAAAIVEETATDPQSSLDPSLDEVIELDSGALLEAEEVPPAGAIIPGDSPATPNEPPPQDVPASQPPSIDPFFGMSRDMGSFVGGIPLALKEQPLRLPEEAHASPLPPPPAHSTSELEDEFPTLPDEQSGSLPGGPVSATIAEAEPQPSQDSLSASQPPTAPHELAGMDDLPDLDALDIEEKLTFSEDAEPVPALDTLLTDDSEPLELFDETAQKLDEMPEALEPIEDVGGALAEEKAPEPEPPPPLPPEQVRRPASPFAGVPLAGAPPRPKVTPPPPPRTSPLRSFTQSPFDASPEDASAPAEGVPPFAGERPPNRGRITSFEGLAMPPVREADVFSNSAFSGLDDVFFSAPSRDVPPIPSGKRQAGAMPPPGSGGMASQAAPVNDNSAPGAMPGAPGGKQRDRKREAIPPNRQALRGAQPGASRPLAQPAPPPAQTDQPKRVPWWKRVRTLLPIMFVFLFGAWAGIYFGLPPRHVVEGVLRFEGLENLDTFGRKARADSMRKLLRRPEVRLAAAAYARNAGMTPGFLDDPAILEQLSEPSGQANQAHSEFDDSRRALLLFRPTVEPDGDRIRMKAVLGQLYGEDGAQRDRAASAQHTLQEAQSRVAGLEQQRAAEDLLLKRLSDDVTAVGGAAAADVLAAKVSVQTLEQQDQQLRVAWQKAIADLGQRKAELEKAQTAPPSDAQAAPQADAELARLKARHDSLERQLQAAQTASGGNAAQAAEAFEAAFARFEEQLATLDAPADNVALTAYLESARSARDEVRQILRRTQSDAQALGQIRRDADQQAPDPAASDGPLHDLLEARNAYAHRYEAAAGSGLAEDALKIRGVLDDLDQKIDARRQALKTGGSAAAQPAQESIAQLERDRRRDPQRISERLKRVEQAAPPPQAIPEGARAAVAELGRRVSGALAAVDRYAAALAAPDDTAAQTASALRSQLADVQAQLEQRRKALADAAAAELDQRQRQQRQSTVAVAQKAVASAMNAEAAAAAAYTNNRKLLSAARDLTEEKGRAAELMQNLQVAREELNQQKQSAGATATVLPPDDNSVLITYAQDRRVTYLAWTSLVIVLFFGILMWAASSQSAPAPVPFANAVAVAHDVPGHRAEAFERSDEVIDDDQQPLIA